MAARRLLPYFATELKIRPMQLLGLVLLDIEPLDRDWDSCIFKFVPFFFAWVEENKEKEEKGREREFKKQIAKIVLKRSCWNDFIQFWRFLQNVVDPVRLIEFRSF